MAGAERAMLELISGLRQKGVACFVLLPEPGPIMSCLERDGTPFAILPYQWWVHEGVWRETLHRGFSNLRVIAPVARQLDQWQIDIVWTNSAVAPPVGAWAAKTRRLPHIWFLHEFVKKEHGIVFPLGIRLSCKIIAGLSRYVVVCSKALEDYYAQYIPRQQLRVVYQAIQRSCNPSPQEEQILRTGSQAPKLLLVGWMYEGKRQIDAIRALGHLAGQGMEAELFLMGSALPSYLQQLEDAAAENKVERRVHFCGYVEGAAGLMKEADVVLSCSMWEAFPRVVVEAMRAGKPLVAARHAGTAELVCDGFNGLLYAPGDPIELAAKIRQLAENPELAVRLGENGRQWAETQFSVEKYAERVLQILSEVSGTRQPGPKGIREL
jgi:glycosyltransferase involved in cell wall biosynthesis